MLYSWEDVKRVAVQRGLKRAGWGTRVEGGGVRIEHEEINYCKITFDCEALAKPFVTSLTYDETVAWLYRNDWRELMVYRTAIVFVRRGRWCVLDCARAKVVAVRPTKGAAFTAARAQGYIPVRIH